MNRKLANGRMCLHISADFGQVKVAEYLIDQGADVNVGDAVAIHAPAKLLEELSVSLLPQAVDVFGQTPLLAAVMENHIDCVKLLLDKVGAATGAGVLMR